MCSLLATSKISIGKEDCRFVIMAGVSVPTPTPRVVETRAPFNPGLSPFVDLVGLRANFLVR